MFSSQEPVYDMKTNTFDPRTLPRLYPTIYPTVTKEERTSALMRHNNMRFFQLNPRAKPFHPEEVVQELPAQDNVPLDYAKHNRTKVSDLMTSTKDGLNSPNGPPEDRLSSSQTQIFQTQNAQVYSGKRVQTSLLPSGDITQKIDSRSSDPAIKPLVIDDTHPQTGDIEAHDETYRGMYAFKEPQRPEVIVASNANNIASPVPVFSSVVAEKRRGSLHPSYMVPTPPTRQFNVKGLRQEYTKTHTAIPSMYGQDSISLQQEPKVLPRERKDQAEHPMYVKSYFPDDIQNRSTLHSRQDPVKDEKIQKNLLNLKNTATKPTDDMFFVSQQNQNPVENLHVHNAVVHPTYKTENSHMAQQHINKNNLHVHNAVVHPTYKTDNSHMAQQHINKNNLQVRQAPPAFSGRIEATNAISRPSNLEEYMKLYEPKNIRYRGSARTRFTESR